MTGSPSIVQARIPSATYRLQFNRDFTFSQAEAIVDYLRDLGISDCYASPLQMARPGSTHGYDVIDHGKLDPELGTEQDFAAFALRLKRNGMSIVMDVVPNHMCIAGSYNRWWNDVLENGPSSPFANYFDIDWSPPKSDLANKVLLPVLGDQYGRILENQEIRVRQRQGAFFAHHYDTRLPIAPRTYSMLLEPLIPRVRLLLGEADGHVLELESIVTALSHLPSRFETDPARLMERRREKEIIKRRLAALLENSEEVRRVIRDAVREINGKPGEPRSFDQLEDLLAAQAYRLSFWRVASDEINYRRFFDINELAAIRVEEGAVFAAVHEIPFRLMRRGWVTGLRIDHVDGLFDPQQYFRDLQRGCLAALRQAQRESEAAGRSRVARTRRTSDDKSCYVIVEKILGHRERLSSEWAIHGTTGYDFLNLLNGVFVDTDNEGAVQRLYERFAEHTQNFGDLVYDCKKLILQAAMSGELHVLARRLDRISEQHRYSRDFTLNSQQSALGEVIACLPVYRSYTRREQTEVSAEDRRHIVSAIRDAKRRNPATDPSVFDFIASLLLLEDPDGLDAKAKEERREFVMRLQQLTGPVMAKGLEDTAFYRYCPLASLNEVGGEPARFGVELELFHQANQERLAAFPNSMLATSTHDTKRSEDVRARINVLSEMPARWYRAVCRWRGMNRHKEVRLEEAVVPDANEEYLLYQTLIGTWSLEALSGESYTEYVRRIEEYMVKAVKEAKLHSSWISPNEEYENAVCEFVRGVLERQDDNRFLSDFAEFLAPIAYAGMLNSLSQTLLKIAAPGVPDFYQGTEVWDLSLVDPDNRRPVDYSRRRALLASIQAAELKDSAELLDSLMGSPEDGRIKLYLTSRALAFRREHRDLFATGAYRPLYATGDHERHVIGFARTAGDEAAVVAVARFFGEMGSALPIGAGVWRDSKLVLTHELGARTYRDVLTGKVLRTVEGTDACNLKLAEVFAHAPAALLERVS